MLAKILFVSDLHKRDCDFTTIAGYTKALDAVQHDILRFIVENGVTHLISLGDWYDKGYRSINRCQNDRNLDEELAAAVNGNFYICLGNHFFLERDNNPEMYLIQPNDTWRPAQPIHATVPIIRAVPALQFGPVRISFFHYSKTNKDYVAPRPDGVTYHIGLYHDEVVLPSNVRKEANIFTHASTANLDRVLQNIDLAIVGHIHKPCPLFYVTANGRRVPVLVPGSLANTQTGDTFHTTADMPLLEISDAGKPSLSRVTFDLHCNLLRLYKRKQAVKAEVMEQVVPEMPALVSLKDFLFAKGYAEPHINLVEAAAEQTLDPLAALKLLGIVGGNSSGG